MVIRHNLYRWLFEVSQNNRRNLEEVKIKYYVSYDVSTSNVNLIDYNQLRL